MRLDKFTIKAQEAVVRAQELAQQRDHSEILPLHLLTALLDRQQRIGALRHRHQRLPGTRADRVLGRRHRERRDRIPRALSPLP